MVMVISDGEIELVECIYLHCVMCDTSAILNQV